MYQQNCQRLTISLDSDLASAWEESSIVLFRKTFPRSDKRKQSYSGSKWLTIGIYQRLVLCHIFYFQPLTILNSLNFYSLKFQVKQLYQEKPHPRKIST